MSTFDHFVGTRAVSDQHAFDIEAMTAWLRQHVQGFEGPLQVEMLRAASPTPPTNWSPPAKAM